MTVTRLTAGAFAAHLPALAEVLVDAVAGGASVGFLEGFGHAEATAWWQSHAAAVADGRLVVWIATGPAGVTGTVSLAYAEKPNARHRAEVVKLAVRTDARGSGLGRRLLAAAEEAAAASGITLLLLDTESASAAERLYETAGWQRYGIVPGYAAGPAGELKDCSFFFKTLG